MLKKLLLLSISALALCAAAETQTLKVDRFQKVRVIGPANVDCIYNPDSVGYIIVNAPRSAEISWIEASVKGDKLKVESRLPDNLRQGVEPIPADLPSARIYTNYLTEVSNEGDSIVRVITATNVPAFTARLIGNGYMSIRGIDTDKLRVELLTGRGTIAVKGRAQTEEISLAAVGTIEADGVEARSVKVNLVGTGNIGCWAVDKLHVRGTGSGTVYFRGTPEIKKHTLGISLQPLE